MCASVQSNCATELVHSYCSTRRADLSSTKERPNRLPVKSRPVMMRLPRLSNLRPPLRVAATAAGACLVLWQGAAEVAGQQAAPASRPNIVLMFPDNLGWGE